MPPLRNDGWIAACWKKTCLFSIQGLQSIRMALTEIGKTRTKLAYLATQLAVANTHLHLYEKLRSKQNSELRTEFYKSKDFWGFTLSAHIQIAMLILCRIYDGNTKAIHMFRFLNEIPVDRFSKSDEAQSQAHLATLNQASLSPALRACLKNQF